MTYGIGVGAVITNSDGLVLIQDHVKSGKWTIPVGKVDEGEVPEDALKRELMEELNLELTSSELVNQAKVKNIREIQTCMGSTKIDVLQLVYVVEVADLNTMKNMEPEKHTELKWVSPTELLEMDVTNITKHYLCYLGLI